MYIYRLAMVPYELSDMAITVVYELLIVRESLLSDANVVRVWARQWGFTAGQRGGGDQAAL